MNINIKKNKIEKYIHLPHIGQRIIKTSVAVFLCCIIYMLRGYQGLVMQSTVAAIICIQPYRQDSIQTSVNRIIGTLTGAFWGLLFLWLIENYLPVFLNHMPIIYFLMAVGVVSTLYTSVAMKKTDSASLAAIVFICIVVTYPDLEAPVAQTIDRIIDTIIGIFVAGIVNTFSLPRKKHMEYIFFVRFQDLVPDRYSHVSSNILVILNRLFTEGARICLVSKWAPAFVLSQMGIMDVNLPVIVMNGVAMYDMYNRSYEHVIPIDKEDASFLCGILQRLDIGYYIYTIRYQTMMIYTREKKSWAEIQEYELMRRSPYRNYMFGDPTDEDQLAFIRILDRDDKLDEIEQKLHQLLPSPMTRFRIERMPQPKMEGYSGLYFYNPYATIEHQKKYLLEQLSYEGETGLIPIDMNLQDGYTSHHEAIHLLNKIRHIYEPIA